MSSSIGLSVRTDDPPFDVLETLGEGAFGKVLKAINRENGGVVAIKIINFDNEEQIEEVLKEISILRDCESSHTVGFDGCWNLGGGELWIAMEYCAAGSITDMMRATKRTLTEDQIAAVCYHVVQGLSYLHGKRVIHRDIKADNVLLTDSGQAKLADFGVSAQLNSTMESRHTKIGSPYWMAPEIITSPDQGYDRTADIWSLGITALEMADGRPPRAEIHFARVVFVIPFKPPPTFEDETEWSDEFIAFTARCLQKTPEDRPSAQELTKDPFILKGKARSEDGTLKRLVHAAMPLIEDWRARSSSSEEGSDDEGTGTVMFGGQTVEFRSAESYDTGPIDVGSYDTGAFDTGPIDAGAYDTGPIQGEMDGDGKSGMPDFTNLKFK